MGCAVTGCDKPAKKKSLCWGHYKRDRCGQNVNVKLRDRETLSPQEALLKAACLYADAEDDHDYELRKTMLYRAARRLAHTAIQFQRTAKPVLARKSSQYPGQLLLPFCG